MPSKNILGRLLLSLQLFVAAEYILVINLLLLLLLLLLVAIKYRGAQVLPLTKQERSSCIEGWVSSSN